jgi:DNA-binding response OmpR family regulator
LKKHILILDDEAPIRDLLRQFLDSSDYRVTTVATASAALKSIRSEQPDLVISDLQLEDSDGLEMIAQLKGEFPNTPVILLTGVLFDPDVVDKVLSSQVSCYLEKTSSLTKIRETVESLLAPSTDK